MRKVYTIVAICPPDIQQKFNNLKKKLILSGGKVNEKFSRIVLKDLAHCAIKRTFVLKKNVSEKDLLNKLDTLSLA